MINTRIIAGGLIILGFVIELLGAIAKGAFEPVISILGLILAVYGGVLMIRKGLQPKKPS